jgi:hypothetical protein
MLKILYPKPIEWDLESVSHDSDNVIHKSPHCKIFKIKYRNNNAFIPPRLAIFTLINSMPNYSTSIAGRRSPPDRLNRLIRQMDPFMRYCLISFYLEGLQLTSVYRLQPCIQASQVSNHY